MFIRREKKTRNRNLGQAYFRVAVGVAASVGLGAALFSGVPALAADATFSLTMKTSATEILSGETVDVTISYACSSATSCNGVVIDLPRPGGLPDPGDYGSTTWATPVLTSSSDVSKATANYDGSVRFTMKDAVAAGSVGTLTVHYSTYNILTVDGAALEVSASATGSNIATSTAQASVTQTAGPSILRGYSSADYYAYLDRDVSIFTTVDIDQFVNGTEGLGTIKAVATLPEGAVFVSAETTPDSISGDGRTITWDNFPGQSASVVTRSTRFSVKFPSSDFTEGQNVSIPIQMSGTTIGGLPLAPITFTATATLRTFTAVLQPYTQMSLLSGGGPVASTVALDQEMGFQLYFNNYNSTVPATSTTSSVDIPADLTLTRYGASYAGGDVVRWRTDSGATGSFSVDDYPEGTTPTFVEMGVPAGDRIAHLDIVGGEIDGPGGSDSGMIYGMVTGGAGKHIALSSTVTFTADDLADKTATGSMDFYSVEPYPAPSVYVMPTNGSSTVMPGDSLDYSLWVIAQSYGGMATEPVVYMPIPAGTVLDSTPVTMADSGGGIPAGFDTPRTEIVHNAALNQDVLKISWPEGASLPIYGSVNAIVHTKVRSLPPGTLTVNAYVGDARGPISDQAWSIISPTALPNDTDNPYAVWVRDNRDIVGTGDTDAVLGRGMATVMTGSGAGLNSQLAVKGSLDSDFVEPPTVGATESGQDVTYRLPIENTGNVDLSDIVIYDILPAVGDTGVSGDSSLIARGSQFTPQLDAPITAPDGFEVWYSASTNPCRPEVFPGQGACDADWTQTPADITATRAVKFVQESGQTLVGGESTSVTWSMRVSQSDAAGSVAVNSAAFSATRDDDSSAFISEPPFVSVQIAQADLALAITDTQWTTGHDQPASVTVTNHGPSASAAHVEVTFPAGVTARLTEDSSAWDCQLDGQVAKCDSTGTLAVEVPTTLPLTVNPAASLEGKTVNLSAVVSGPYPDPEMDNNSATAQVKISGATVRPSPTPTGTATATPQPSPTVTATSRPSPTGTGTPLPTSSPTATPTVNPTAGSSATPSATASASASPLARSGSQVAPWLVAGLALAAAGGLLIAANHRRATMGQHYRPRR